VRYVTTSKWLTTIVLASALELLGGDSSFGQIAPGAPGGVGMGGAAPGGFAMGAGGANGAGFGMGAGAAGSGFTGSGVGIGTFPSSPGAHVGTMLPGPRGNTIQQSPGVNGFGTDLGISGGIAPTPRFGEPRFGRIRRRGSEIPIGRGRGPVPDGGEPNPAETLLKDMEGTNSGRRSGHAAILPAPRYRRSHHGLSSEPLALRSDRVEEQAVYFAKRGDYEDVVYRTHQGAYRRNEAGRSAGNRAAPRPSRSQTRSK